MSIKIKKKKCVSKLKAIMNVLALCAYCHNISQIIIIHISNNG